MVNFFTYVLGRLLFHFPTLHRWMSDRMFVENVYRQIFRRTVNLDNPRDYCEKLNYLKLYDRRSIYTTMADKVKVKKFVADIIGDEYIIPTIKTYHCACEIKLEELPEQFVLKCNHDSGSFVICRDKNSFNLEKAREFLDERLSCNYYMFNREWPYKNIERCIFAEEYVEDNTFEDLVNYKFLCFNGEPKLMYITVKTDDIWENFYDMEFRPVDISYGRRKYEKPIEKPAEFEKLKELAAKLSSGLPFIRVDFYIIKGAIFFSEYTFYDWGGFAKVMPQEWNRKLGDWIFLPEK